MDMYMYIYIYTCIYIYNDIYIYIAQCDNWMHIQAWELRNTIRNVMW